MEYFIIEKYIDWEIDTDLSAREDRKFFKQGNNRVSIWFYDNKIQESKSSKLDPYTRTTVYDKRSNLLRSYVMQFYQFPINVEKVYDNTGIRIEEIDHDKPYAFPLQELVSKIRKEHSIDLEDLSQNSLVNRWVEEDSKKPFYEVLIQSETHSGFEIEGILLDGITGDVLFETTYFIEEDQLIPLYDQYLYSLLKKEKEDNAHYKTYKGKAYTKREWENFKDKWNENNEKKNESINFWGNVFNRK